MTALDVTCMSTILNTIFNDARTKQVFHSIRGTAEILKSRPGTRISSYFFMHTTKHDANHAWWAIFYYCTCHITHVSAFRTQTTTSSELRLNTCIPQYARTRAQTTPIFYLYIHELSHKCNLRHLRCCSCHFNAFMLALTHNISLSPLNHTRTFKAWHAGDTASKPHMCDLKSISGSHWRNVSNNLAIHVHVLRVRAQTWTTLVFTAARIDMHACILTTLILLSYLLT